MTGPPGSSQCARLKSCPVLAESPLCPSQVTYHPPLLTWRSLQWWQPLRLNRSGAH